MSVKVTDENSAQVAVDLVTQSFIEAIDEHVDKRLADEIKKSAAINMLTGVVEVIRDFDPEAD